MNVHFPASRRTWPGRLVNLAVAVVVLAIAAGTFIVSYPGVHAIVLQAGVSTRFARVYPGLFDALFVVACVAAVMLRDARWWARCYAWLVIIVVVAAVGAADAVHAMNVTVPHRTLAGVVAAAPWAVLLLGFSLMLAMLRQSRAQHIAAAKPLAAEPVRETRAVPRAPELPWSQESVPVREAPALPQAVEAPAWEPAEEFEAQEFEFVGTLEPDAAWTPESESADTFEADDADVLDADRSEADAARTSEADAIAAESVAAPTADGEPAAEPAEERADAADTPEADAVAAEPVPTPLADGGQPPEAAEEDAEEQELAEQPSAAAPGPAPEDEHAEESAAPTAEEHEPAEQPSAAANGDSGPDGQESPVTEEQGAEVVKKFSILDFFTHDEDEDESAAGTDGAAHPATLPGQVLDDDDAPPFATAPFATIPRLNRVRSAPTPPEDDDENE